MLTSMPLACDVRDGPFATSPDYTSDRTFLRKPYAGNLHVRFEEEGPTSVGPPYSTVVRGPLLPGSPLMKEPRKAPSTQKKSQEGDGLEVARLIC